MHEGRSGLAPADAGRQARSDGDRSAPCSIAHLDFRNDSAFDSRPLREPPVRDHLPAAAHTDFARTAYSDCTCSASSDKPQPARRPFNLNAFSLQASPGAGRNRSQKRRTHVCSHICIGTPYLIHYFDLLDPPPKRTSSGHSRSRESISGVSKRPLHRSPSSGSLKAAGRLSAGSGKAADQSEKSS